MVSVLVTEYDNASFFFSDGEQDMLTISLPWTVIQFINCNIVTYMSAKICILVSSVTFEKKYYYDTSAFHDIKFWDFRSKIRL